MADPSRETQFTEPVNDPASDAAVGNAGARKRSKWVVRLGALVLLAVIISFGVWFLRRPKLVTVVNPYQASMTETIASSARVGGLQEAAIGAQFPGTVGTARLFLSWRMGTRSKN